MCGTASAKIRSIQDENRKQMATAEPGMAVETFGWKVRQQLLVTVY